MRLSLLFIFIPIFAFSNLVLLNLHDHKGYIFSNVFKEFDFSGECRLGIARVVSEYVPPDPDVDVFNAFPKFRMIYLENGLSVGTENTDLVVPKDALEAMKNSKILCIDSPIEFLSPSVLKLGGDMKDWQLGGIIGTIMKALGKPWELPVKKDFKSGEVVKIAPQPPIVEIEILKFPGVGIIASASVTDFSKFLTEWDFDGSRSFSKFIFLPPGEHEIELKVSDFYGLTSEASTVVNVPNFRRVVKRSRCEIGLSCPKRIKSPGIHVFLTMKPDGYIEEVLEATETTFPKVFLNLEGGEISGKAEDPSGAKVFVFVNGRSGGRLSIGENAAAVIGVDPYGNTTLESTEVTIGSDVRKILGIRSGFILGWGR